MDDYDGVGDGVGAGGAGDGGVGAGGGKGKDRFSASSSKPSKSKSKSQSTATISTRRLTKTDKEWPKDIPEEDTEYMLSWNSKFRDAIDQGFLNLCWAVAIAALIQALLLIERELGVELSPQHLVNNIENFDKLSGRLMKYNEVRKYLTQDGLVKESICPYNGKTKQSCPKTCLQSHEPGFKIKDLIYLKGKEFNEKDLIKLLKKSPVLAVIEAYESFRSYQDGIYEGRVNKKDKAFGRHVVIVTGYGTTPDGVNYWTIQNSWGTPWGTKGFGSIIRQSSRGGNNPSLFLKIIRLEVRSKRTMMLSHSSVSIMLLEPKNYFLFYCLQERSVVISGCLNTP